MTRHRGWVAGEAIAGAAGVSRARVGALIQGLRDAGFRIESSPRRGYRLVFCPDRLDPAFLDLFLPEATLGRTGYRYRPLLDSTNTEARRLADAGAPHGLVVAADAQTAGRGRLDRTWHSPPGAGLYVSVLLRSGIPAGRLSLLAPLAAIAAAEAVRGQTGAAAGIKWPNDLVLNGRKIAGVLIEASSAADVISHVIIGLGINVNTTAGQLPRRPLFPPTSLWLETGRRWNRALLLADWLGALERLLPLDAGTGAVLRESWRDLSATLGRRIVLADSDGSRMEGEDCGIDDGGALLLRDANGLVRPVYTGDLSLLPCRG